MLLRATRRVTDGMPYDRETAAQDFLADLGLTREQLRGKRILDVNGDGQLKIMLYGMGAIIEERPVPSFLSRLFKKPVGGFDIAYTSLGFLSWAVDCLKPGGSVVAYLQGAGYDPLIGRDRFRSATEVMAIYFRRIKLEPRYAHSVGDRDNDALGMVAIKP